MRGGVQRRLRQRLIHARFLRLSFARATEMLPLTCFRKDDA
jgi:hypothetical protein